VKRLFDILVSMVGLICASPLFLVLAAWIKLDSHGPVFYRGVRVGRYGRSFRIFKFRSMVVDAEQRGGASTSDGDKRVTRPGRLTRKCKVDELSQLLNVLVGDMSLVGPRPEVRKYTDLYTDEEKALLLLRPGITDWASIWNADEGSVLAGASDPDRAYETLIRPTKLKLQLLYARRHDFWTDLRILFYTIRRIVSPSWLPRELEPYGRLRDVVTQERTDPMNDRN
jgi:lipopolysaccharide/colanic/teichoic acid biosynthesis glycosyltransferase